MNKYMLYSVILVAEASSLLGMESYSSSLRTKKELKKNIQDVEKFIFLAKEKLDEVRFIQPLFSKIMQAEQSGNIVNLRAAGEVVNGELLKKGIFWDQLNLNSTYKIFFEFLSCITDKNLLSQNDHNYKLKKSLIIDQINLIDFLEKSIQEKNNKLGELYNQQNTN